MKTTKELLEMFNELLKEALDKTKSDSNRYQFFSANFTTKTVFLQEENQSIKFEIWDTAGQEKYRALTKIFYKDAGVAILVYDITRKESCEEIQKYWYNQIKDYAPKNISK